MSCEREPDGGWRDVVHVRRWTSATRYTTFTFNEDGNEMRKKKGGGAAVKQKQMRLFLDDSVATVRRKLAASPVFSGLDPAHVCMWCVHAVPDGCAPDATEAFVARAFRRRNAVSVDELAHLASLYTGRAATTPMTQGKKKKQEGGALLVTRVQPALWSKESAGNMGPSVSASSSNAIPMNSPSRLKASVPFVMSKKTPRIPFLLKAFPYLGPLAQSNMP